MPSIHLMRQNTTPLELKERAFNASCCPTCSCSCGVDRVWLRRVALETETMLPNQQLLAEQGLLALLLGATTLPTGLLASLLGTRSY